MLLSRLSVEEIIKYDLVIVVHKILREICPENLKGKFTNRTQISKYETHRMNDLQMPRPRLEISKRSFYSSKRRKSGMRF